MCGQKAIFSLFGPIFEPRRATFGTFWVWQMAKINQPGCLYWWSNLVPPLPTQNRPSGQICEIKRLFLAYFGPFLSLVRPHLGHSGSGKWVKLINLDVLSAVPTLFQHVPINRGSHMAIILKMPISALFWAFWGLFEGLNMRSLHIFEP